MLRFVSIIFVSLLPISCVTVAQAKDAQTVELGTVNWTRDFDSAKSRSKQSGKPIFILFTEVPGCDTVKGFGRSALSAPLIVEAIETSFEPVVVYNNVTGADRKIVKHFKEPTWNNPVVRLIDHAERPLGPRFSGPYDQKALLDVMILALQKAKRKIPGYLTDYHAELSRPRKTALFSMYCFWTGEAKFGSIQGVFMTRPGFLSGHEVVEVTYDPTVLTYSQLVGAAKRLGAADNAHPRDRLELEIAVTVFANAAIEPGAMRYSKKDDKHFLPSKFSSLDLTPGQATKLNASIGMKTAWRDILSPRQKALATE